MPPFDLGLEPGEYEGIHVLAYQEGGLRTPQRFSAPGPGSIAELPGLCRRGGGGRKGDDQPGEEGHRHLGSKGSEDPPLGLSDTKPLIHRVS